MTAFIGRECNYGETLDKWQIYQLYYIYSTTTNSKGLHKNSLSGVMKSNNKQREISFSELISPSWKNKLKQGH